MRNEVRDVVNVEKVAPPGAPVREYGDAEVVVHLEHGPAAPVVVRAAGARMIRRRGRGVVGGQVGRVLRVEQRPIRFPPHRPVRGRRRNAHRWNGARDGHRSCGSRDHHSHTSHRRHDARRAWSVWPPIVLVPTGRGFERRGGCRSCWTNPSRRSSRRRGPHRPQPLPQRRAAACRARSGTERGAPMFADSRMQSGIGDDFVIAFPNASASQSVCAPAVCRSSRRGSHL